MRRLSRSNASGGEFFGRQKSGNSCRLTLTSRVFIVLSRGARFCLAASLSCLSFLRLRFQLTFTIGRPAEERELFKRGRSARRRDSQRGREWERDSWRWWKPETRSGVGAASALSMARASCRRAGARRRSVDGARGGSAKKSSWGEAGGGPAMASSFLVKDSISEAALPVGLPLRAESCLRIESACARAAETRTRSSWIWRARSNWLARSASVAWIRGSRRTTRGCVRVWPAAVRRTV